MSEVKTNALTTDKDEISLLYENLRDLCEKIFVFLEVSSLSTGFSGFFMTYIGFLLLGMTPNINSCFAVFLVSFSVYNLNKLTDLDEDAINMPERLSFLLGKKKLVLYYSLAAYVLSIVIMILDNFLAVPVILIPLIANAVYSSKLIPGFPRLKDIPVMKNVTVAISWASVTTLLPASELVDNLDLSRFMEMLQISAINHMISINLSTLQIYDTIVIVAPILYFMFVKDFINTVLYDIRDVKGDCETGIRTVPVILGPTKTIIVLLILNSTILPILILTNGMVRILIASLVLYGYIYVFYFRKRRQTIILNFLVDGEWMLACILIQFLILFNIY